jgi:hypothetical protein
MSMGEKVWEGVQLAICSQSEGVGTVAVDVPVPRTVNVVDVYLEDVGAHYAQRPSLILIAVCFSVTVYICNLLLN